MELRHVLLTIRNNPNLTVSALAGHFDRSASAVSYLLIPLAEKGLVHREKRGSQMIHTLTPAGEEQITALINDWNVLDCLRTHADITPAEVAGHFQLRTEEAISILSRLAGEKLLFFRDHDGARVNLTRKGFRTLHEPIARPPAGQRPKAGEKSYDVIRRLLAPGRRESVSDLVERTGYALATVCNAINHLVERGEVIHEREGRFAFIRLAA